MAFLTIRADDRARLFRPAQLAPDFITGIPLCC
jgi:hypothetical protein